MSDHLWFHARSASLDRIQRSRGRPSIPQHDGWHPCGHGKVGYRTSDDSTCANDGVAPDIGEQNGGTPDPATLANRHEGHGLVLHLDSRVHVIDPVPARPTRDVHTRRQQGVRTDVCEAQVAVRADVRVRGLRGEA